MRRHLLLSVSAASAALLLPLVSIPSPGQTAKAAPKTAAKWVAPKTPWGEPDIQGWFTNVYENGTPMEKPDQFKGRSRDEVSGDELVNFRKGLQDRTLKNFEGPIHGPDHWWQDALHMEKGGQAWFIVDPADGKIPALVAKAKDRAAVRAASRKGRGPADSWLDRSTYDRCLTRGMPGSMMPAIYGNSYQIVQSPGYVTIRYEMVHEARIIPIVKPGQKATHNRMTTWMGDPIGHWEGDTLVVETVRFRDEAAYRNANGSTLKVTERFRRTAPNKVAWAVTLEDPETWERPWTFAMPLTENDEEPVLEYACHEGNYGLRNILSGARADEAAAAAGKK